jgi:GNAT superfamily N-acetyltransferase
MESERDGYLISDDPERVDLDLTWRFLRTAYCDRAAFAWIADVFVLEAHRGRGLGRWLLETLLAHPALDGLRVVMLATADAHELYEGYGFRAVDPERYLELRRSTAELHGAGG